MHATPYTEKTQDDPAPQTSVTSERLPLRKEVPDFPMCDPPQKDMSKTVGGKLTDFFIYKVLGFGVNSATSVGITYWVNPQQWFKNSKESLKNGLNKVFRNIASERSTNAAAEIMLMLVSGTAITAIMAPLVRKRDDIAYWINKKLGKDTDVLPERLKTYEAPVTLEDKIEQELKKRVNYGQTSRDLWKARWSGIFVPLLGDPILSKWNDKREAAGKWSTDSISWQAGFHLYDKSPTMKQTFHKMGEFFKRHEAGIDDIRRKNAVVFNNLERYANLHDDHNHRVLHQPRADAPTRDDRMMIADQTRLLGKEVGWTLILAEIVEHLTKHYQDRRICKQELKAIAKMREEGIIPAGVVVKTDKDGHVKLTTNKAYVPYTPPADAGGDAPAVTAPESSVDTRKWADEKVKKVVADAMEKPDSHTAAAEKSRIVANTQASLAL